MAGILNLREVIETLAGCRNQADVADRYGWLYCTKGTDDLTMRRFYMSSAVDESGDSGQLDNAQWPAFAIRHDMHRFLEVETVAEILDVQKRQQPLSQPSDYAAALAYYLHNKMLPPADSVPSTDPADIPAGLARGIYPEYDLILTTCPPSRVGAAARALMKFRKMTLVEAMAQCRQLPVIVAERVDGPHKDLIAQQFIGLSLPLSYVNYSPLIWQLQESPVAH